MKKSSPDSTFDLNLGNGRRKTGKYTSIFTTAAEADGKQKAKSMDIRGEATSPEGNMGHSSLAMTMDLYSHVLGGKKVQEMVWKIYFN